MVNRGTETSTVPTGTAATVKDHANFEHQVNWLHQSGFRCVMHANGDANRELILTVPVFHVPRRATLAGS